MSLLRYVKSYIGILFLGGVLALVSTTVTHATLTDNLVGFWNLNETSGTRADSAGSNTLSNNGSVGSAPGKVGNAASFSGSNYLSIVDNAALSMGDIDFTVAGWVYLDNKTANRTILAKFDSTAANQREYAITYNSTSDKFNFIVSNNGIATTVLNADNFGSPSVGAWYYVVGWHDSVNNTINIQVNNGSVNSAAHTTGVFNGTALFTLGATNGGIANLMVGRVDAVGVWKRVLTVGERTTLYNSGSGAEHPLSVPGAPTSLAGVEGSGQVALSWTPPIVTGGAAITDYIVEYKLASEPTVWTTFADGISATPAATVTGLTDNSLYNFRVSAVNVIGTSAASSTVDATPIALTVPGSPTTIITTPGVTSVDLSWTTPSSDGGSSITDYLIEYKLSSEPTTWTTFTDGTSTTTSTIVTGLTGGSSYDFRVSAVNGVGTGIVSSTTSATTIALTNNVVAFWTLNESSGSRADSAGSNTLSNNGSVGSAAGKVGNAASFSGSNYLSIVDNAALSMGDIDFTIGAWVYLTSKATNQAIAGKWGSSNGTREYVLLYNTSLDRFTFTVSNEGTTGVGVTAVATGPIATGTWYYIAGWHDSVKNTINIQVNDGVIHSTSHSAGVIDGTSTFAIGAYYTALNPLNGRVDAVGIWKRILNTSDRTTIYASGSGQEYPFGENSITINSPKSYQVIQRDNSNEADITIDGTYTGTPTSIEASWNGGPYTTIVASPSGGTFSGTLSNQTAGQGTLSVRFVNDTLVSASASYVGIGDIFVIAGQSNAEGYADNNQVYSHGTLKATMFANDDNWKELIDPTDINTNQVDSVSDDSTARGSVWPLLSTHFMADQNVPIAFIPTAKGGSIIRQWQKSSSSSITNTDTTAYSTCSTTLNSTGLYGSMSRRIAAVGGSVKAVVFHQGETDTQNGLSQANYYSYLKCFTDNVYTDFAVPTVVAQIGPNDRVASNDISMNHVRTAQRQLWDEGENGLNHILAGPTTYNITAALDGVHFVSDTSLQILSDRWWAALKKHFYGGTDGRGPRLSSATYNTARTEITLTFTDESLPILPASNIQGFSVRNNGTTVSISSVSRISNNQIRINLVSAAAGTITVSLGYGISNTYGSMNIPTDSSTYNLPIEFFANQATTLADTPSTPTSLIATPAESQVSLSWTAPSSDGGSSITDYLIEYKLSSEPTTWTTFSDGTSTTTSATVTSLTGGSSYDFRVSAVNGVGQGSASSVATATPTEPPLPPSTPPQQTVVGFIAPRTTIPSCAPGHRFNSNTGAPCPSSAPTIPPTPTSFTRDLYLGMSGPDVTTLQRYLNTNGFIIAPAGPGSPGNETAYFGLATKAALRKLQLANNIRSTGNLGPVTRKVIEGR